MSISYWRNVDYTDDGCSLYECLNCYEQWEARTDPEYAKWKFCPYCGCEWEGEKEWNHNAKWEHKKGQNPDPNARLALPIFMVQKKNIPFDEKDIIEEPSWITISNQSEDIINAIHTMSFDSLREAEYEPFFSYSVYRIVYNPHNQGYRGLKDGEVLKWTNGIFSKEQLLDKWKQHKESAKKILDLVPSKST